MLASVADVTQILNAIERGDPKVAAELLPLVYDELRNLAAARLGDEKPGQTLQPTALVHEAYLRLVGNGQPQNWNGRRHFFAAAAEAMRHVLVDQARRKLRVKRGGGRGRVELDDAIPAPPEGPEHLLALDEALTRLAALDPEAAGLVNLRYFAGLSVEEAADTLGISRAGAYRHWAFARAWLLREMDAAGPE
jgi:RNA polymerase sigma factor (TIGR02999 family)